MLTIFAVPKAFQGDDGRVQRNALRTWSEVADEILLFGDDPGVAEAARDFDVRHLPDVARSPSGKPLLDGIFDQAQRHASSDHLLYVNADIIVLPDFVHAAADVWRHRPRGLVVSRRQEIALEVELGADGAGWQTIIRKRVADEGRLANEFAINVFAFPRGAVTGMPPFVVGRPGWDNWMIYHALEQRRPVINVTPLCGVVHQDIEPGYARGKATSWDHPEARHNRWHAGWAVFFSIADCTHRWDGARLRRLTDRPLRRLGHLAKADPTLRAVVSPARRLVRGLRRTVQGPEEVSWLTRPGPPPR